ncbi:SLATT domain-containing protein [Segnochrobactraceae bacterium EtOH-i3]
MSTVEQSRVASKGGRIRAIFYPLQRQEIEHPRRLLKLRDILNTEVSHIAESELFFGVDDLAQSEIEYYYKKRKLWALGSSLVRSLAWGFGLLGVLMPFVAAIYTTSSVAVTNVGFMLIAISAAFAGANSLFGLTAGHMRFLIAQLRLERLMTTKRLAWRTLCETSSAGGDASPVSSSKERLDLISDYANRLYDEMAQETDGWAQDLSEAVKKLTSDIAALKKSG